MIKLLVKDPKTGNIRPMTQKSFDLVGKKRMFTIVGKEAETGAKSTVQLEMDRLRAEQAAKNGAANDVGVSELPPSPPDAVLPEGEPRARQKPGPKPKSSIA